jgi:hypothetical protein
MTNKTALRTALAPVMAAALFLTACSDGSDNRPDNGGGATMPFQEIYDQGITRYLGQYTPMQSDVDGDVTKHKFGAGDGPLCRDGSEYHMFTRDQGSDSLIIYLEGGGACWSTFCSANTSATPEISAAGILDPARENNPTRTWNQVFVPYCDGGLHGSDADRDVDLDGDGNVELHRGLHNLSATLGVAARTFPAPKRILLAGESGGGFGTIFATALVRYVYPDVRIDIVNDSGVGVLRPGEPEFVKMVMGEWNALSFFPESCPDCIAEDGHITEYLIWQLEQDTTIKRGMLSYNRDFVLSDVFLQIGKDAFEAALYPEMAQLEEALPDRNKSWIPKGELHTFLRAEPDQTAGGVPVLDWVGFLLDDSDEWVSVQD